MAVPKQILLLVETSRVFGRGVIQGISRFARERANWIFHFEDRGILEGLPPWLENWQGDGIIARSPSIALSKALGRFRCPVVELLGDGQHQSAEVCTDERMTAGLAIDHLLKQGFAHLAFYSFANSWWSDARRIAFEQILASQDLSGHVFPGAYEGGNLPYPTWKLDFQAPLIQWVDRLPKPVGVWAVADSQAIRVLEACRQLNLHVPAEVGILGTSNEDIVCSMLSPSLSSIELNSQQVGYKAAGLLDWKIRMLSPPKTPPLTTAARIIVPPSQVIKRQSTDRIAIIDPELDQAVKIIEREAVNGLTVTALADELLLSRSTLERRFREFFHCSPSQEINHIRIERAKGFLRETAWPISVIGQKTGFASAENFVRFFKRMVGKTPRQYRNAFYGTDSTNQANA
ncbi:XylR family transcriptional regulator [Novipirellula artificiosorum]|uniref:Xylose operon regulatory protein n=1 Tax=Novipirellula artificiosorum TaxID=2528016 RepID=A0A5C6DNC1_9BACT|nr:DNA-binding transcriptional regulator [Novipirellula artificiosorum]TWU37367.1 Xylose operon regulatory protein [Novipirellula artificiosorum]